jgi:hypothetical protein
VIFNFPRQQWLRERASVLRYTHIAFLFRFPNNYFLRFSACRPTHNQEGMSIVFITPVTGWLSFTPFLSPFTSCVGCSRTFLSSRHHTGNVAWLENMNVPKIHDSAASWVTGFFYVTRTDCRDISFILRVSITLNRDNSRVTTTRTNAKVPVCVFSGANRNALTHDTTVIKYWQSSRDK